MLIKKIKLENFRQFVGAQEIEFSTDREKNVTLVIGDNGSGKTTISQAFVWCLYGEVPGFSKKDELLSYLKRGEASILMKVSIEMLHEGKSFTLQRTQNYHSGRMSSSQVQLDYVDSSGESKNLWGEKATEKMKEILPQELAQYFFLTGEKIDSMSSEIRMGKSKNFSDAVNSLLGLDYYKKTIRHLKGILKKYSEIEIPSENAVNLATFAMKAVEKQIQEQEDEIKKVKKNLESNNQEILDIQVELKSMKSSADIQKEKEFLEAQKKEKQERREDFLKRAILDFAGDKSDHGGESPYFLARSAYHKELKTLNEILSIPQGDVPEKLHADLIDWIEDRHRCICGAEVHEGQENYDWLEKYRKIIPPESISTLTHNESERIISKFRLGTKLFENFQAIRISVDNLDDEINSLEEQIEMQTEKLKNSDDTSALQKRLSQLEDWNKNSDKRQEELLIRRAELENSRKIHEKERDEALQKSKEGQFILKCKNVVNRLQRDFETHYQEAEESKRSELISAVKKAFLEIYGNTFSIEIDEKYNIETNPPLEKSTGQGMSVIFAFLAGLLSVIRESQKNDRNELESYPLVFDAPFSALDETRISSVCEVLPKVSSQIMIFIKDTDGNVAKDELGAKIGKNYVLKKKDGSDQHTEIYAEAI